MSLFFLLRESQFEKSREKKSEEYIEEIKSVMFDAIKHVFPMHLNEFDKLEINPENWIPYVRKYPDNAQEDFYNLSAGVQTE